MKINYSLNKNALVSYFLLLLLLILLDTNRSQIKMDKLHTHVIEELSKNASILNSLLINVSSDEYNWKAQDGKWSLLEIICHLRDEEKEDFRQRTKLVLENTSSPLPPINPPVWVEERAYKDQVYDEVLRNFLDERKASLDWLKSLNDPDWNNSYNHPKLGMMTAKLFLTNWLAHDYLHIKQILSVKHQYLKAISSKNLSYAGDW